MGVIEKIDLYLCINTELDLSTQIQRGEERRGEDSMHLALLCLDKSTEEEINAIKHAAFV